MTVRVVSNLRRHAPMMHIGAQLDEDGAFGTPTQYRGVWMRSVLEADFAYHLDRIGERDWQYEPELFVEDTGKRYLPDFLLHPEGGRRRYIELKPTLAQAERAKERIEAVWKVYPDAVLVVVSAEECRFFIAEMGHEWGTFVELWRHD